ncbi:MULTISPECIES: acyl-CoA dehydrogenase family protein [unclassified Chelatococcus]|uniref:acyl-CoA dehydrogenase family protein n=1 Tax=unclassified Chelatococcus TaxID=2638111 RepID=UPI001BD07091|nr:MULTISPECIES: acyl-CoA dehydrogenase family protein [unclassified Chelatococcus]CAH1669911.1 Acyl-CoA dehydrogenase [Hyphomicrobiales bacterium]MBS7739274.1 acyl-CoA dehydrogenase family protein [Chelatococcus sp. HY11]MBX3546553.1 acyl-CoA dehydrogenase family protein [Chelatococcus sp.]MCO5076193.1 acyl-CoA dehydrogenase family protein [Chelatococcus sp.]CAH1678645.1 Acyl-CoA dehydrogenase [Hyphomicrobiales bacterium]
MVDTRFLDWPFFTPSHRALRDEIATFARETVPGLVDHHEVDGSCRRLVDALGRAGILRHAVIAPHGGKAETLDVRSLCLIRETLGHADGLADFAFAMQGLGSGPICLFGTDEQKSRYLPRVAAGEAIAAFALTEPVAGSDVAALATTAEPDGPDHVRITGEKTWISNGGIADQYVVFCRTGEGPGTKGMSAFVVEAGTPGFTIAERLDTIAPHPLARLAFDGCRVPVANRIGKPGEGFKIAMATLDVFRSTVGAAALGFARRALDETLQRVTTRQLFGGPLADLQMVQGTIADMVTDVEAAALMVYRAAWTKDNGAARITREASLAKLVATENAQRVIDAAVQLHGGDGVRVGSKVEELYRDIRALRIYEGASDVQKVIIARQTLADFAAG